MIGIERFPNRPIVTGRLSSKVTPWLGLSRESSYLKTPDGIIHLYHVDNSGPAFYDGKSIVSHWWNTAANFKGKTSGYGGRNLSPILTPDTAYGDGGGINAATPLYLPATNEVLMYYTADSGQQGASGSIWLAVSTDGGYSFTKKGVVIQNRGNGGCFLLNGKVYLMAGESYADPTALQYTPYKPGYYNVIYESTDNGRTFTNRRFAIGPSGTVGALDYNHVEGPRFLGPENGYVYCFMACGSHPNFDWPEGIQVWRTTDTTAWEKYPCPVLLRGGGGDWDEAAVWTPAVMRANGKLFMAWEGLGTGEPGGSAHSTAVRDGPVPDANGVYNYPGYYDWSWSQICGGFDAWSKELDFNPLPDGDYIIAGVSTGKLLCPFGDAITSNNTVAEIDADLAQNYVWRIERFLGFYRISLKAAGAAGTQVLGIQGAARTDYAQAGISPDTGAQSQRWHLGKAGPTQPDGSQVVHLQNRYSGMSLTVGVDGTSINNAVVTQHPDRLGPHQRFEMIPLVPNTSSGTTPSNPTQNDPTPTPGTGTGTGTGTGGSTPTLPNGFYMNGATSPALKAAVSRVKANTGRARMVMKGDSTTVGQGGGSSADGAGLTGARANRISKVLAGLLTNDGIPTLDGSIVSDNGMYVTNFSLPGYDTRTALYTPAWGVLAGQALAGGGYLSSNTGALYFSPDTTVDTFEIVYYQGNAYTLAFTIDGIAPASGPASITVTNVSGLAKVVVKAASVGTHFLKITGNNTLGAVRSITAYNSTAAALDIVMHASLAATSANQAAAGANHWSNNDSLGFDAPDLTTINLGLNDMAAGVTTSAFTTNLQTIITKAKVSGDVLLVFPTPAGGSYNTGVADFNTAAKNLAASNGIPFLSLYEYYGLFTSTFGARLFDGAVHPKADLYAEIAGLYRTMINAMVAANSIAPPATGAADFSDPNNSGIAGAL